MKKAILAAAALAMIPAPAYGGQQEAKPVNSCQETKEKSAALYAKIRALYYKIGQAEHGTMEAERAEWLAMQREQIKLDAAHAECIRANRVCNPAYPSSCRG